MGKGEKAIDIYDLLNQLEELVEKRAKFHLWDKAWGVDLDRFYMLTNKIRANLPQEIQRAAQLTKDAERVMEEAKAQAEQVLKEAEQKVSNLILEDEITVKAKEEAEKIIKDTQARAAEIKKGADEYAAQMLTNLERHLTKVLETIRKGKEKLKE